MSGARNAKTVVLRELAGLWRAGARPKNDDNADNQIRRAASISVMAHGGRRAVASNRRRRS